MSVLTMTPVARAGQDDPPGSRGRPDRSVRRVAHGAGGAGAWHRPPSAPSAPLRLTRRGRLGVALAAFPLCIGLPVAAAGLLAGGLAPPAGASGDLRVGAVVATHVVSPGESLWSIALDLAPGEDPRELVGDLIAMNGLEDPGRLDVGQELMVPLTG